MKAIVSILMLFSFLAVQANAHPCFGECSTQKSEQKVETKADHSCCHDLESTTEKQESDQCDDNYSAPSISLSPEIEVSFASQQSMQNKLFAEVPSFSHYDFDKVLELSQSTYRHSLLRPRYKHGLYIILKRLRLS